MDNLFDLPPLPEPDGWIGASDLDSDAGVEGYTADQMRSYARAAVEAEREACAKVCEDHQEMREATGHPREASTARKLAGMIHARGKT